MASGGQATKEFHGDFVAKNEEEQIVTAPVLIPDKPDRAGDVISEENIEEVAYKFLADYQNVDLMHTFKNVGVPVESYVAPTDIQFGEDTVPKGAWVLSVKVENQEVWEAVKSGELTGFSIYGAKDPDKSQTGGLR
jgi:hypothetical protein